MQLRLITTTILGLTLIMVSCGNSRQVRSSGSSLSDNPFESPWYYFNTNYSLSIEVFYEPGADPYVGETDTGENSMPQWQVLEDNVRALFYGRTNVPVFDIPKKLESMTKIETQNKTVWVDADIYHLATQLRKSHATEGEGHFVVLFLKGNYSDGIETLPRTLGVMVGETSVIAIFKDVVEASDSAKGSPRDQYMEQSTLVHEMGHALGLVNNGLPFVNEHEDHDHTTHCTNTNCVMHWTNENNDAPVVFWENLKKTGSIQMFGDECLKDARLYRMDQNL